MIHHTKKVNAKKALLILIATGFIISCRTPTNSCSRFHKGDFSLIYKNEPGAPVFLITRTDSIQTEINHQTGNYSKLSISWTGNCTYELRLIETSAPVSDNRKMYRMIYPMEVEIIQSTEKYYVFQKRRYPDKNYIRDTMWVRE